MADPPSPRQKMDRQRIFLLSLFPLAPRRRLALLLLLGPVVRASQAAQRRPRRCTMRWVFLPRKMRQGQGREQVVEEEAVAAGHYHQHHLQLRRTGPGSTPCTDSTRHLQLVVAAGAAASGKGKVLLVLVLLLPVPRPVRSPVHVQLVGQQLRGGGILPRRLPPLLPPLTVLPILRRQGDSHIHHRLCARQGHHHHHHHRR